MPDLFDAGAERAALGSSRPVSQERLRILGLDVAASGSLFAQIEADRPARCIACGGGEGPHNDAACEAEYNDGAELDGGDDDGRECPDCGADLIGNDPHAPGCPRDPDARAVVAVLRDRTGAVLAVAREGDEMIPCGRSYAGVEPLCIFACEGACEHPHNPRD